MGKRSPRKLLLTISLFVFACGALRLSAQDTPQQPASSSPQNPNKQDAPAEARPAAGDSGAGDAAVKSGGSGGPVDLKASVMSDAAVQAMLDVFPAEIEDVEEI